ncbi:MAG: BlaI/MecI/CopY family transcriptional regulator [Akkermansiaceae bacterium]|jgi:predicted transcriptional regulator
MNKPTHPSNLELQALSVLWHEGPSTVSLVHESLPDGRERAYTTVLSVMQSLERKKLVRRIRSGRAHVYESAYSQEIIVRRATDDFVTNAFGGRLGEAVLATLSLGTLTPEEKTNIERELKRHKTMPAKKTAKKAVKKAAPKKAAKKAAPKKAAVKKAAPKKAAKKAAPKKAAKKAAPKKAAKKVAKSAKKAAKKVTKKVTKKVVAKKAAPKKAAKKAVKKAAPKKAAKKAAPKKAAKKAAKKK